MGANDNSFTVEVEGSSAKKTLQHLLQIVSVTDDLNRARIELQFDGEVPISLDRREGEQPEQPSEPEPDEKEATLAGVKLSNVPTVNASSESYKVLWALSEADAMLHTPEIRSRMKREYDIGNEDSISKNLYNLEQRGMVQKQQSDRDGRMNKYAITSKGKAAMEKARQ